MALQVKIISIGKEGQGVGWIEKDGVRYSVFVPFTTPGDLVEVEVLEEEKRYIHGKVLKIIEKGPSRVEPKCAVFEKCGGCQLQHIAYPEQLAQKLAMVKHAFKRVECEEKVKDVIGSLPALGANIYHYRHRAKIFTTKFGVGLKEAKSNNTVTITECPIWHPTLNQKISSSSSLKKTSHDWVCDETGKFLGEGEEGSYHVGFNGLEFELKFEKDCFIQANLDLNKELVRIVCEEAQADGKNVLDIYCGVGNFTIPIASVAKNVIGIEGGEAACAYAEENAKNNGLSNVEIMFGDSMKNLIILKQDELTFNTIIIDPPRTGAKKECFWIPLLIPERIVYVGCELDAMIEDMKDLQKQGFEITKIIPIDMFPQTAKIECVVVLTRGTVKCKEYKEERGDNQFEMVEKKKRNKGLCKKSTKKNISKK